MFTDHITPIKITIAIFLIGLATFLLAADDAVPGEFLYPTDIALEKIQYFIAGEKYRPALFEEFKQERLKEQGVIISEFSEPENQRVFLAPAKSLQLKEYLNY